ncbi:PAB1-binding protein 1 [Fulvia fulva]|uniref:PAB1-binding protein 1 n=1 Tax=Passalora fulva TaxID=5499 RepID=A0A9Q8PKM7_PASFU|nr:PAB1-binding protein 1 [Fulvia fulva]UJO24152.1 PAB1-binding protein 1 [Fulvia fulva]WPV37099.1 PAB1-binding protein 1 [Fulvia fulva]
MSAVSNMNGGDTSNATAASKHQLKSSSSAKALDGQGQHKKQQQPANAWQNGRNPITSRNSSTTPNGTEKPLPKLPSQGQQLKSSTDLNADKHAHDRSMFLFAQFVGKDVSITLKNGEQYSGVFSAASLQSTKTQYVIKMARRIAPASDGQVNGTTEHEPELIGEGSDHILAFDIQDTIDLSVQDVSTTPVTSQQNGSAGSSFRTDTQISARESDMLRARELQPFDLGNDTSVDLSLESSNGPWDQFATNEALYGINTTYDEEQYTTAIRRDDPKYSSLAAKADKIAREIEGSAPANAHVAEERRQNAEYDGEEDEEAKYSGVRREASNLPTRGVNSYVPPSQRQMTALPTVPGAPFDPAIISAQVKTTAPSTALPEPVPAPHVEAAKQQVAPDAESAVSAAPIVAKKGTTEDRVRDTADAFRNFANGEKLKVRHAQEVKRASQRQEKNVKLNDLKKFSENFKLKSRVPDDLVPILAKDAEKQAEIKKKAEQAAKEEEGRAKDKTSDKASAAASPAPPSSIAGSVANANHQAYFNQQTRARVSGNMAGLPMRPGGPAMPSPRGPNNQRMHNQFPGMPLRPQPLPTDMRMPTGPPAAENPLSPGSRLNVKAFEFRPAASNFTPTGTTPSPQRRASGITPPTETTVSFFKNKVKDVKEFKTEYNPVDRLAGKEYSEAEKKKYASNGGVPQAYNTPPTWPHTPANQNSSYLTAFPPRPSRSQGPSPMQTPNPNAQMPHAHQLPPHMQPGNMSTPTHRPFYPQQHGQGPAFDPRLQQHMGPNGSVQNSPRVQQVSIAPFNAQIPPMGMMPTQPMQGYGMSPSMQYRQPSLPGGPPMMMPGQMPGQMGPMQPGFPPGPQFRAPQMGGHMMVQNPSQGYMNGPVPNQNYSPMPPHAQPHMPHMQQHGPAAYNNNSPRPPMMQPGGSHQGFQPGMPMQPNFAPSPGQPHPYHLQQQRAMSGGFPHMTPRQQHAVPNHGSPGMGAPPQGDEGK